MLLRCVVAPLQSLGVCKVLCEKSSYGRTAEQWTTQPLKHTHIHTMRGRCVRSICRLCLSAASLRCIYARPNGPHTLYNPKTTHCAHIQPLARHEKPKSKLFNTINVVNCARTPTTCTLATACWPFRRGICQLCAHAVLVFMRRAGKDARSLDIVLPRIMCSCTMYLEGSNVHWKSILPAKISMKVWSTYVWIDIDFGTRK